VLREGEDIRIPNALEGLTAQTERADERFSRPPQDDFLSPTEEHGPHAITFDCDIGDIADPDFLSGHAALPAAILIQGNDRDVTEHTFVTINPIHSGCSGGGV
jgi:hypothetical protein